MADKVYGLSEDGFRRVREATRRVLGTPKRGSQQRRQAPILSEVSQLGKANEQIPPRSSGSVRLWKGQFGSEEDTGKDVQAFNIDATHTIESGQFCNVFNMAHGVAAHARKCCVEETPPVPDHVIVARYNQSGSLLWRRMPSGGDAVTGDTTPIMMSASSNGVTVLYLDNTQSFRMARFGTDGTELWDIASTAFETPLRPTTAEDASMVGRCLACDDSGNTIILSGGNSGTLSSYAHADGSENWSIIVWDNTTNWVGESSMIEAYNQKIQVLGEYVPVAGTTQYYIGAEFNQSGGLVREFLFDQESGTPPSGGSEVWARHFVAFDNSGNLIASRWNDFVPGFLVISKSSTTGGGTIWSDGDDAILDATHYGSRGFSLDQNDDVILAHASGTLKIVGSTGVASTLTNVQIDNDGLGGNPIGNQIKWAAGERTKVSQTSPLVIGFVEFDDWGSDPNYSSTGNLAGLTSGNTVSFSATWGLDPNNTHATHFVDADYAGGCYVAGVVSATNLWP